MLERMAYIYIVLGQTKRYQLIDDAAEKHEVAKAVKLADIARQAQLQAHYL